MTPSANRILIIGERINSTSRKVKTLLEQRDAGALLALVDAQSEAGADYLDLNASMLMEREGESLEWLIDLVGGRFEGGLTIDSPNLDILLSAGEKTGKRGMLNSLTCDAEVLERALPVVSRTGSRAIIMLKDQSGIPETAQGRITLARKAVSAVEEAGIDADRILLDPVFAPIATAPAGLDVVLETLSILREDFSAYHRVGGLSNVSYGMPLRKLIHRTFLAMLVAAGITSIICDPTDSRLIGTLRAAETLTGLDRGSKGFLQYYRARHKRR